jgi:hypothetical protein
LHTNCIHENDEKGGTVRVLTIYADEDFGEIRALKWNDDFVGSKYGVPE